MAERSHGETLLVELPRDECLRLLTGMRVGRVGVSIGALPVILPVNYVVVGGRILFRTASGTKLAAATREAVVAFEVDSYDPDGLVGWSVLVLGRSSVVRDAALQAQAQAGPLESWAFGEAAEVVVQILPSKVTGRSFRRGVSAWPGSDEGI